MMHITSYLISIIAADGLDLSPLPKPGGEGDAGNAAIDIVLPVIFGTLGSIALLIIVISGFRYIVAGGDPAKTAQAKKAILYAVIGLVVALAAFSIVTFVLKGIS
ncbi:MAG: hypothetical protein WAW63_02950 [Candidatus Saccharimonadales bacterium]|nr:hypothetical protein [Candidatus Saccharibacteria bacterium]